MDGGSVENSLRRIETALERLERIASAPAASDDDLQVRHEKLRAAVSQSLRKLDVILAGQEK